MEKVLSLKEYQQSAYREEKAEFDEVVGLIKNVLPLYKFAFLGSYWPYVAQHNAPLKPYGKKSYSGSTNAMIMVMLSSIKEKIGFTSEKEAIERNIKLAKNEYFKNVFKNNKFHSFSKSYGINDPLNLYWAHILCEEDNRNQLKSSVHDIIKKLIYYRNQPRDLSKLLRFEKNNKIDQQQHSFVALYAYRCALRANLHEGVTEQYYNFFELRLHQHLSFKSIPDSRFDPSELVFCLEGMLLSKPSSVSSEILHRVFEVLGEAQDTTPCWRPVNPIYAAPQGQVFLPLSIEVGMSLLSVFEKIDSDCKPQSYFAKYLPILQRYFRWLKAQEKTIKFKDGDIFYDVSGWESEHVGNEGVIHIWQTALILDYLASYAKLLKKHIAKQFLISSGLSVQHNEYSQKGKCCVFSNSNPFPTHLGNSDFTYNVPKYVFENFILSRKSNAGVFNCAQNVECCSGKNCPARFSCIGIERGNAKEKSKFSLLLYGPPGTGKSFFTKEIARCLKWKHITVTPSDFLADGSAEIEARAKGIFACLMEQEDAVILFDEIDQFILDRDSRRYREQTDVFKLLTPGMLPKFQDLRDKAKCIFVIATNYAERIDPAIVRLGRIDVKIPLMPPSWEMRKLMCQEELSKNGFDEPLCHAIALSTSFYTWNELKKLIEKISENSVNILKDNQAEGVIKFISMYSAANLTFKKVFQRFGWEPNESDLTAGSSDNYAEKMIIEELALMCMLYGVDIDSGKNQFLEITKEKPVLRNAVFEEIDRLFQQFPQARAT